MRNHSNEIVVTPFGIQFAYSASLVGYLYCTPISDVTEELSCKYLALATGKVRLNLYIATP
jgi:hypothetical protein